MFQCVDQKRAVEGTHRESSNTLIEILQVQHLRQSLQGLRGSVPPLQVVEPVEMMTPGSPQGKGTPKCQGLRGSGAT